MVGVAYAFREDLSRQSEILTRGYSLTLRSDVSRSNLNWNDEKKFESIATELAVFDGEMKDFETSQTYKINSLEIVYTSTEQNKLPFTTADNEIISGGSHKFDGSKLTLNIYVNEGLAPDGDVVTAFNIQVLQFLVVMSEVPKNLDESKLTTINDRSNYFYGLLERHFAEGQSYPINII